MQKVKRIVLALVRVLLIAGVLAAVMPFAVRGALALIYRGRTYTPETAPTARVAIIFGAQIYHSGRLSAMLADRVETGIDLYNAGKVDLLLMTGDNSRAEYDEPGAMRAYAIERGVPEDAIAVDYGGRRTYDSCYRAKHIFEVDEAILVTQNFHLDRALLLCNALGVKSVGVWADYQRPWGYSRRSLAYSRLREYPAIFAAMIDLLHRSPPPVMGEPLPLFKDR